ncbi:MAG: amidohydrolase [Fimbriimonadaceae bacterium]|nr:amidohydrolase [Fimbriimonadaceae bacterium]QYK58993.1 MAG: amidohydrolase [Fimbriimonadaceae bacterium]
MKKKFMNGRDMSGNLVEFAVEGGRFVDGEGPETVDLQKRTVLPGFVDSHCHIIPMGLDLQKLNLSGLGSREQVLDAVLEWHSRTDSSTWLLAVHYDQTRFSDGAHLTCHDLDRVVPDRPVLLRHSNGHASVANSAALKRAGVGPETPDPPGGAYGRDANGSLTGVLLERSHEFVTSKAPEPTLEEMTDAVMRAGRRMAQFGITSATDMMTGRWNLERELLAYHRAAQDGCPVRLRLSMQWGTVLGPRRIEPGRLREILSAMDEERCKSIGLKIFADGAIGSATAAIHGEFTGGGNGTLIYQPDRLRAMVLAAHSEGWAVAVHSIGDRSTDLVLDAFEATGEPCRHRIEHVMLLSDRQIDRLARLNPLVTMQPEFLMRFRHSYRRQLGQERAFRLKRARSVLDAGLRLSFSSDAPIVPGDPWDGIRTATDRPEGFDPNENIELESAVRLYTRAGAQANGDEEWGGEILPGAWADFQVYDGDPGESGPVEVWRGGELVASN